MQQFKTYPGIPPNGVVERPSILRIPPFHPTDRPPSPPPPPLLLPSRCPLCPLASYLEFRSYKVRATMSNLWLTSHSWNPAKFQLGKLDHFHHMQSVGVFSKTWWELWCLTGCANNLGRVIVELCLYESIYSDKILNSSLLSEHPPVESTYFSKPKMQGKRSKYNNNETLSIEYRDKYFVSNFSRKNRIVTSQ